MALTAAELRPYLERLAREGRLVTYREVAAELAVPPPATIHQVVTALEETMAEDAAAARPFAGRARDQQDPRRPARAGLLRPGAGAGPLRGPGAGQRGGRLACRRARRGAARLPRWRHGAAGVSNGLAGSSL
ncbi:MAG: hypothetical protein U5K43_01545 [Halofilum sp. (in: g-proteobacteria)]|nr:hypothetical protein [Halofilum sp. (in: g-proteobacteria)]